eukprot:946990-Prorocentrum_minimum.AAC.3
MSDSSDSRPAEPSLRLDLHGNILPLSRDWFPRREFALALLTIGGPLREQTRYLPLLPWGGGRASMGGPRRIWGGGGGPPPPERPPLIWTCCS